MYLIGVVRLFLICFLAVQISGVQAERIVSLATDEDMALMPIERRRFFKRVRKWIKRKARKVSRWYRKTHSKKLRRCKRRCVVTSLRCGKGYKACLSRCVGLCYGRQLFRG